MTVRNWSTTAANNNSSPPNGWPENMQLSDVNNSARQGMADVRSTFEELPYFDWGHTPTRTSNTTFTVSGDKTSIYVAGLRIKCTDSSTLYGTIASSSYSAPNTTVTVTLDSGNLSASLTKVAVSVVTNNDLVNDTTPQLGGNLDANGFNIDFDNGTGIRDDSGNEQIKFAKTASAVNEFTVTNAATGAGATLSATGGDTNIDVNILAKGTGAYNLRGTADTAAELRLFEDTDNGTNYMGQKVASNIASSFTITWANALPASTKTIQISNTGAITFDGTTSVTTSFTSSAQTIAVNSTVTVAHGLGAEPDVLTFVMQCTSTDRGYSVGDRAVIAPYGEDAGTNSGFGVIVDSTNVIIKFGDAVPMLYNKTTPTAMAPVDPTKWQLYIKAYKFT